MGFKDDLRNLQSKLKSLDAILSGAQSESFKTNALLDDWLKQVRQVAFQAENVSEEYSYELLMRSIAFENRPQSCLRCKTNIRSFLSVSSNPIVFRLRMAPRVKSLRDSIDKIYYEAHLQGIRPIEISAGAAPSRNYNYGNLEDQPLRIRRERPDDKALIGRDGDRENVLGLLRDASNSDKLLSIVGIFGMAGLGKTALCKSIFEEDEIRRFEKHIWKGVTVT